MLNVTVKWWDNSFIGKRGSKISNFKKWMFASLIMGLVGFVAVFFIEDFARISGELNRSILFIGTLLIFGLLISSFISLMKANVKRLKKQLVLSAIIGVIPFSALVFNGLIFVVYFVGK